MSGSRSSASSSGGNPAPIPQEVYRHSGEGMRELGSAAQPSQKAVFCVHQTATAGKGAKMDVDTQVGELIGGGWQALGKGAWEEAFDLFTAAVQEAETPEALEGLGVAASWTN